MELIRGSYNLSPRHRGCVTTIGNFDGVHCGHQAVLQQVTSKAKELRLPSQVVIFEPLPREFFSGPKAPARLTRFREKLQVFQHCAIDRLLCLRFNQALADMLPERFIKQILVEGLGVRYLVVGDDFQFGRDRKGNYAILQAAGREFGFEVTHMPSFVIDGKRASSTLIRHALQRGDLETARRFLGRPYRISGRVVQGERLGRKLGFPTANVRLGRQVSPVNGVFAAKVHGLNNYPLNAVVNIGTRPTVNGTDKRIEVHLLDFTDEIYGWHLHVDLLHKLRDETRFDSLEALKTQIQRDVAMARNAL
ncbi:MAG: bifunctional riboflavin kinase/FAD synthetase [Pseudomonadota bacterium]